MPKWKDGSTVELIIFHVQDLKAGNDADEANTYFWSLTSRCHCDDLQDRASNFRSRDSSSLVCVSSTSDVYDSSNRPTLGAVESVRISSSRARSRYWCCARWACDGASLSGLRSSSRIEARRSLDPTAED